MPAFFGLWSGSIQIIAFELAPFIFDLQCFRRVCVGVLFLLSYFFRLFR